MWGRLPTPQWGHTERPAVSTFLLADRREWVLLLLVLRFGTAMVVKLLIVSSGEGWAEWGDWSQPQIVERVPAGIGPLAGARALLFIAVHATRGTQAGAVGTTQRNSRQIENHRVAQRQLEVDHIVDDGECLSLDGLFLEQLADRDRQRTGHGFETAAAGPLPRTRHGPVDDDSVGHVLQSEIQVDLVVDRTDRNARSVDRHRAATRPASARSGEKVGDISA